MTVRPQRGGHGSVSKVCWAQSECSTIPSVSPASPKGGGQMALPPYRVDYSPIVDRPPITWPNNARVAFWVAPNVEHYEYLPDFDGVRNPWPRTPYPDAREYSYRDYGNRIGFWRMVEVLDAYGIKCCVSLNLAVLEHYPEI